MWSMAGTVTEEGSGQEAAVVLRDEGMFLKEMRENRHRRKMRNLSDTRTGARFLWEKESGEVSELTW